MPNPKFEIFSRNFNLVENLLFAVDKIKSDVLSFKIPLIVQVFDTIQQRS